MLANTLFRVGLREVEASGFVVDIPAVTNQSISRLLGGFDSDVERLPCMKADGRTAT